jgi:exodeoxyribonuclease V alpha subunit
VTVGPVGVGPVGVGARSASEVGLPSEAAVLRPFVEAGVFDSAEVQLAATVARLCLGLSDEVVIAVAVAARGPRLGHVCVELADVAGLVVDRRGDPVPGLPWPDLEIWAKALRSSDAVAGVTDGLQAPLRALVWDGRRVYLQRYWHHEHTVARALEARAEASSPEVATRPALEAALDAMFRGEGEHGPDRQRLAARRALAHQVSVIAGGPGTGKTRTIARLLAAAQQAAAGEGAALEVALVAPTGKAAARMAEAVHAAVGEAEHDGTVGPALAGQLRSCGATTLHRLLGWAPGAGFRHHRHDPLPHDLVVVDEASMVSLPLMSGLLAALRPDARLVLVGDPFQLASVEAGSVLSDVVGPAGRSEQPTGAGPLAGRVTVLHRVHRFSADSAIASLAEAIRVGDADRALATLDGSHPDVTWVRDTDRRGFAGIERVVVDAAVDVVTAARAGDALGGLEAAGQVKVLSATRRGTLGLHDWSDRIERAVADRVPELARHQRWYVGRPIIVTANDELNHVANGDVGLVVRSDAGPVVALALGADLRFVPPSRLDRIESWWAMTIHKSQGSEFRHVVVSLPPATSPILSRELLYTAVTRGKERVTVVGGEAALRAAIGRPVSRASGLGERLWPGTETAAPQAPTIHRDGHTPPLLSPA